MRTWTAAATTAAARGVLDLLTDPDAGSDIRALLTAGALEKAVSRIAREAVTC